MNRIKKSTTQTTTTQHPTQRAETLFLKKGLTTKGLPTHTGTQAGITLFGL